MGLSRRAVVLGMVGATGLSGLAAIGLGLAESGESGSDDRTVDSQSEGRDVDPKITVNERVPATTAGDVEATTVDSSPESADSEGSPTPSQRTVSVEGTLGGRPIQSWRIRTTERGSVTVGGPGSLDLQVYKCNEAFAATDLGDLSGEVVVTFDWTFEADGWYEGTWIGLEVGTDRTRLQGKNGGIEKEPRTQTEGTFQARATVDGPTTLRVGIVPSSHCGNGDHAHSYLSVRNLSVRVE